MSVMMLTEACMVLACLLYQPMVSGTRSIEDFDLTHIEDSDPQDGFVQFGDLFKPKRFEEQKRAVDAKNVINVCYFCDLQCEQQIEAANSDPQTFFDSISASASKILSTASDEALTVKNFFMLLPKINVPLSWYTEGDLSTTALRTANHKFWRGADKLYEAGQGIGCEAGFYVGYQQDSVFQSSGGQESTTNVLQLCTKFSYGTMMLHASDVPRMSTLLAHVLGRLMGAYDDGPMDDDFNNSLMTSKFPTEIELLLCSCTASSTQCPADPSGVCVMNSAPATDNGYPTQFSDCSRAYVTIWHALATDYPDFYSDSCLDEGSAKRSVQHQKTAAAQPTEEDKPPHDNMD